MFAIEIEFHDGVSSSEFLLMRRPSLRIGSNDLADIVVESKGITNDLIVYRGLGREFSVYAADKQVGSKINFLEGSYLAEGHFSFGDVSVHILSLDNDLSLISNEYPERIGAEAINKAYSDTIEKFPAVVVNGDKPIFVSIGSKKSLTIGRSRLCFLRLSASDLGQEHCRVASDGQKLLVDALTDYLPVRIDNDRVGTRRIWSKGEVLYLGKEVELLPLYDESDLTSISRYINFRATKNAVSDNAPMLIGQSVTIKPSRVALALGKAITVGRDPTNDIWINAGHISRHHAVIAYVEEGKLEVKDLSSNGTLLNGQRLPRGENIEVPLEGTILDFGEGAKICVSVDGSIPQEDKNNSQTSLELGKHGGIDQRSPVTDRVITDDLNDNSIALAENIASDFELINFGEITDNITEGRVNSYRLDEKLHRRTAPVFVGSVVILSILAALFAVWLFNN